MATRTIIHRLPPYRGEPVISAEEMDRRCDAIGAEFLRRDAAKRALRERLSSEAAESDA